MTVYGQDGTPIDNPDLSLGRIETRDIDVTHSWVVDSPEVTHEEVVAEYPDTGGKDVAIVVDSPEVGHWETFGADGSAIDSCGAQVPEWASHDGPVPGTWARQVYVPYTPEELEEIEALRAEQVAERQKAAQREAFVDSAPDRLADMDELLVALYESQLETDEALCALYEGGI